MQDVEIIRKDGRPVSAVVPIELWEELLEKAEMLEDLATLRRVRGELERGETELVPQHVVERLLAGENPVRVWREHRGLSQRELAGRAGLSQAYIAQIETGRRRGTVDVYRRLADALGVEIDDLVD